ncbi:hypothetical protein OsI_02795 [Oryza sativa Indica Group]|uniref:Uncharacterized protein n=1 Tax=Oryza sativa subsp. indica TaxID=39946 RepID=B8ABJ8_ORYSI|nr:hypothetical protein OsI_02795 [Oryza sativa Indica Group]
MESNGFCISSPWRPMDSATCREGDKGTGCVTLAWPSLELWDIREKNAMTVHSAHDGLVAALAASSATGKVASLYRVCCSISF